MTDMRRMTISLPDQLDRRILAIKKYDHFIRRSYSEVVRQILERGCAAFEAEQAEESA